MITAGNQLSEYRERVVGSLPITWYISGWVAGRFVGFVVAATAIADQSITTSFLNCIR
jgi:hypothetical protein